MMPYFMQFLSTIVAVALARAVVCALSRVLQVLTKRSRKSRQCGPVQRRYGPKALPLVGTVLEHVRNYHRIHDWLASYFEKHHTITAAMLGSQECYYTVDPENIKYILKTNFENFVKGGMFHERCEVLLGDGIFNTDGEKWKQQRKTVMPEFGVRSLRDFYASTFSEVALKLSCLLDKVHHQGISIDLQDLFLRMTLDSIGKVGFGVEIGSLPWDLPLPDNAFAKAFDSASETVSWRFIDPFWKLKRFLKVGGEGVLVHDIKVIDSFTYGVIAQRKLEISAARNQQPAGFSQEELGILADYGMRFVDNTTGQRCPTAAPKMDIISRFLTLAEDEKNGITAKLIRDIVLNFVIAGRDSTAVTLSWFIYSIVEKPEIAERIYEELRDFESRNKTSQTSENLPDAAPACVDEAIQDFAQLLTYANLKSELQYLQAALSETLRLFPAVPEIPKGIKDDDVLPDGTHLKGGMIITCSPYCMGRMTYIWGPDAKQFKPERWLQGGKFIPESEFKFSAFQGGSRMCMGRDSAYTQMKITAAILCRFFKFELVEGHHVEYKVMVILPMAKGLKVNVRRRKETTIGCGATLPDK